MKAVSILSLAILLLISCKSVPLEPKLDPNTNYLYADHRDVEVIKEISVHADSLKHLLIVPNKNDLEVGKTLNFFNEVMTTDQFEDAIIKSGFADNVESFRNRKGQHKAAIFYRPFVLLEHFYEDSKYEGLRLYDPVGERIIFENKMTTQIFGGYPDIRRLFPLYNSLLDYLRKQL